MTEEKKEEKQIKEQALEIPFEEGQVFKVTGFTEAPASFNVKAISPQGFDIMLTLRDADTKALIDRAEGALTWLSSKGFQPTGRRGSGNSGNNQANGNQGEAPLCPTHGKPMLPSKHKSGEWFCPVKVAEDDGTGKPVYCKQKVK